MSETRLSIDWISTTDHGKRENKQYSSHPALHDWENWDTTTAKNGYTSGVKHVSGLMVYQNESRVDMGIHSVYSGKTLQRIEQMYNVNCVDVLKHHIKSGHNIARMDIALDFYGGNLSVDDFQDAFIKGQATTKLRSASMIKSLTGIGHTFYLGSRKKRKKLVRVYDKSAEMNWSFPCTRVEVQLMGKPATKTGILAVKSNSVGKVLLGAMQDVVDFPLISEWNKAMQSAEDIKIGTDYDKIGNTKTWLQETVRLCLIRQAVLDLSWWTQYKFDIDIQVAKQAKRSIE